MFLQKNKKTKNGTKEEVVRELEQRHQTEYSRWGSLIEKFS